MCTPPCGPRASGTFPPTPSSTPIHTVQSRFFPLSAVPIFRALAALAALATTPRPVAAPSRHRRMMTGISDWKLPRAGDAPGDDAAL